MNKKNNIPTSFAQVTRKETHLISDVETGWKFKKNMIETWYLANIGLLRRFHETTLVSVLVVKMRNNFSRSSRKDQMNCIT